MTIEEHLKKLAWVESQALEWLKATDTLTSRYLTLSGNPGAGKTALAKRLPIKARLQFADLVQDWQENPFDPTEYRSGIAILDDVGKTGIGAYGARPETVFEHILTKCTAMGFRLVITTNLGQKDMETVFGPRVKSRLQEGIWFQLDGPDLRGRLKEPPPKAKAPCPFEKGAMYAMPGGKVGEFIEKARGEFLFLVKENKVMRSYPDTTPPADFVRQYPEVSEHVEIQGAGFRPGAIVPGRPADEPGEDPATVAARLLEAARAKGFKGTMGDEITLEEINQEEAV